MLAKEKLWTKDFLLLSLSNLFLFFGFQMLLPTLPVYVTQYGGTNSTVGLVIGIFTIAALLIRPFAGLALDTIGRKPVLLIGVFVCLLSSGSYFFMHAVAFILCLRFIHGLGWGSATTTFGTAASDIIPPSRRGEGMGYFGLASTLAMALGPLIGIMIMKSFGFDALFFISAISSALSLLLIQFIHLPVLTTEKKEVAQRSMAARLIERSALFPSLLVMFMTITYGGIVSFITLFGKETGIANVGWFFFANALSLFVVRPFAGKIFDKKGPSYILIPGAFFGLFGLISLSYTTSTKMLIFSAILYGISFGSIQPSLQAWTINRVTPKRRGAANATFYSAFDLGIGGGAMILGAIANVSNYATMYRIASLLFVVYLTVYLAYVFARRKKINVVKESHSLR